jgi:hypothetical protein
MAHANPLHPPVPTDRISPFTSLGDALGLTPLPSTPSVDPNANEFTVPHRRRRLPQVISHPACKWLQATSRKGQSLREHAVLFDYVGHSGGGIPMRELTARGSAALTQIMLGPSDRVFEGKGCRRITLRIMVRYAFSFLGNLNGVHDFNLVIVAWLSTHRLGSFDRG